jgi:hypothetical protein
MSTVPYTFATDTGNIPLNQLDINFANVKAFADTAGYVTQSAQSNITSVGTLTSVSVTGNATANNLVSSSMISATGNVRILTGLAPPVGGTVGAGLLMSSTTNLGVFFGSGAPTLAAARGSLYINTSATTSTTRLYVNTNGATTWTYVTTAA